MIAHLDDYTMTRASSAVCLVYIGPLVKLYMMEEFLVLYSDVSFFPPHVTSYFGSGLAPCGVGLPALLHAQDTLSAKCGGDRR